MLLAAILLIVIFAPPLAYTICYYCWYVPNTCAPYGWIKVPKVLAPGDPGPLSVLREPDGECIGGISNGNIAFDTAIGDGSDKKNAAEKVMDDENGEDAWSTVVNNENTNDSDDAEALIYQEDQLVGNEFSKNEIRNYYDIVVATMLTGSPESVEFGHDNLQGMYVAQKEYNSDPSTTIPVRLLVANIGGQSQYAKDVAEQIVKFSQQKQEKAHFLGVIGWPISKGSLLGAIQKLNEAQVTAISPTASTDDLTDPYTGNNSFFFRINLPNASCTKQFISYAEKFFHVDPINPIDSLGSLKPVAFYDTDKDDLYSDTFQKDMNNDGFKGILYVGYSSKNSSSTSLQELVLAHVNPAVNRLVYFMGYKKDGESVLNALSNMKEFKNGHDLFLGGGTLYQLHDSYNGHYPPAARDLLNFTAAAYPDRLNSKADTTPKDFAIYYAGDFGGMDPASHAPYGYTRADQDVILSYDGLYLMIQGAKHMHKNGGLSLTAQLRAALAAFDASHPLQGESGPIYFLGSGDNQGGQVLIICVNRNGDGGVCQQP
jgi:ABC-type branched-subunit amino acid transport system substrate-binding protein